MPVPDDTYFGPEGITFGMVRKEENPSKRIALLKKRLDSFFVGQIDVLDHRSPFPKAIMTCIAVETIGRIFFKSTGDSKASHFIQALGKLDQRLGNQLSKKFRERLAELWPLQEDGQQKKTTDIKSRAELLYTFFRNSMIHGYRARAVYLSDQEGLDIEEGAGHLVLNPHWLWNRFKVAYEELMNEALDESRETSSRKHCLAYIRKILGEESGLSE